jgi:hypothetical protein
MSELKKLVESLDAIEVNEESATDKLYLLVYYKEDSMDYEIWGYYTDKTVAANDMATVLKRKISGWDMDSEEIANVKKGIHIERPRTLNKLLRTPEE